MRHLGTVLLALAVVSQASAQDANSIADIKAKAESIQAVPVIPAAFALELADDGVARPATLADLAAQANSVYDLANGALKPGVALEIAPFRSLLYDDLTVEEWRKGSGRYGRQVLDSLRLSFATAGTGDAATNVAVGLRISLLNQRDYRDSTKLADAVDAAIVKAAGAPSPTGPDQAAINAAVQEVYNTSDYLNTGWAVDLAAVGTLLPSSEDAKAKFLYVRWWVAADYQQSKSLAFGAAVDAKHSNVDALDEWQTTLRAGLRLDWNVASCFGLGAAGYLDATHLGSDSQDVAIEGGAGAIAKFAYKRLGGQLGYRVVFSDGMDEDKLDHRLIIAFDVFGVSIPSL